MGRQCAQLTNLSAEKNRQQHARKCSAPHRRAGSVRVEDTDPGAAPLFLAVLGKMPASAHDTFFFSDSVLSFEKLRFYAIKKCHALKRRLQELFYVFDQYHCRTLVFGTFLGGRY